MKTRTAAARLISMAIVTVLSYRPFPLVGQETAIDSAQIKSAIQNSLKLLEAASRGSAEERVCFTCHSQAMPIVSIVAARDAGFEIDQENLNRQVDHTYQHLKRGKNAYQEGKGQGGKADTAGYALWALAIAEQPPDEVTDAVIEFLLGWSKDSGHWRCTSHRPPSEASDFSTTYFALYSLDYFATEQEESVQARRESALAWLRSAECEDTEDRVFRIAALQSIDAEAVELSEWTEALLSAQREDGGWPQRDDMDSDAYATGTVLAVLRTVGQISPSDEAFQRGVGFLLKNQQEDGSWHVVSRSKPFQTYFETGYPHEKDQFISTTAAGWATLALIDYWEYEQSERDSTDGE